MNKKKKIKKKRDKEKNDKPISFYPMKPKEVIEKLLKIKPPKKNND